jgi:hypothetical protein
VEKDRVEGDHLCDCLGKIRSDSRVRHRSFAQGDQIAQ